jgi:hypothetical protein
MPQAAPQPEAVFEVVEPDGSRHPVPVTQCPFLIGRGSETGNHLELPDKRISRQCAALVYTDGGFRLEDRGQRHGLYVNGEKTTSHQLSDGDTISFGVSDSYELIFHSGASLQSLPNLLSRLDHITTTAPGRAGLRKLSLLLEATTLLQSHLPLEAVLGTMVDYALALTDADRGVLLEPDAQGKLQPRVARQRGSRTLSREGVVPSQTAIRQSLEQRRSVVTEDVAQADLELRDAGSVVAQQLRFVVVIPLYAQAETPAVETAYLPARGELLGVLYLDSRRPAAFSSLERQILDALAVEAASVLDNARLVQHERERQRLEHQIAIAREIQQTLLPKNFGAFPHLQVSAINRPCETVGGDYFDILELDPGRAAFLLADVSGKGLGAALLSTMVQGALSGVTLGQGPDRVLVHLNHFLCSRSMMDRYARFSSASSIPRENSSTSTQATPHPSLCAAGAPRLPFPPGTSRSACCRRRSTKFRRSCSSRGIRCCCSATASAKPSTPRRRSSARHGWQRPWPPAGPARLRSCRTPSSPPSKISRAARARMTT